MQLWQAWPRAPNDLCFWRETSQNKVFSNQNKDHLGSRDTALPFFGVNMPSSSAKGSTTSPCPLIRPWANNHLTSWSGRFSFKQEMLGNLVVKAPARSFREQILSSLVQKNMGIKFEEFAIFKSARGHGLVPRRVYLSFRCVENKGRIQSLWQQNWLTSLWLNHPSEQNIFVKLDRFPRVKGRRNDWRRHLVDAYGFQLGSSLMFLPLAERGKKQIPNAWYTFFTIYPSNGGRISLIDLIVIYGANAI